MVNALSIDIVQPEALWQRVVQVMRRAIVLGELEPGSHLKEPALAQRFGVSRLPIREAIAQLEREGLVRIEPRRGAYVVGVTEQGISDIYECRLLLESYGIRRAAEGIDEPGMARLAALIDQMDVGVASGQVQLVAISDMAFHRLIIDLSGNRALSTAWEPLAPLIETALSIAEATVPDLPTAIAGHRKILRALQQHDPEAAVTLLSEHLLSGEKLVHEAIKRGREGLRSV
jgi:GntR family transcriptional regulator of gluconate operon